MKALVVVPTYNEAGTIGELLQRIREAEPGADVLVVDDGSPDGTAALVKSCAATLGRIEVLERPGKAGLGTAYRVGMQWGLDNGYTALVGMDADLSHDPAVIPQLLAGLRAGADLVIGTRYMPGGGIPDWTWHRRLLSRWGNSYARSLLRLQVPDSTSGFRAYRREILTQIDMSRLRADGYGFLIEMVYRIDRLGGSISGVPIQFYDRRSGASKMSLMTALESLVLVTSWGLRDRLRTPFARRAATRSRASEGPSEPAL